MTAIPRLQHSALTVPTGGLERPRREQLGVKMQEQPTIFGRRRFDIYDPFDNRIELMTEGDQ